MIEGASPQYGEVFALIRALYSAASGMMAQQVNMDTISNNLANVNTTGYKKGRAEFQDLLYVHVRPPISGDVGIMVGQGSRLSSIQRIFSNGSLQTTGNTYDVAIQGSGFFRVRRPDGTEAFTRDGSFRVDGERRLTTATGDLLLGESGPITIPERAVNPEITADGIVRYVDEASGQNLTIDRIKLAVFPNPAGLIALGDNQFRAADSSGAPDLLMPGQSDVGRLVQGFLEASNVQTVEEMVSLIVAQRAYEINSKAVQSADDMMGMANNLRR